MSLAKMRKIHFVGIGGSGMSGIAEVLLNLGHDVRGSDMARNENIARLEGLGARVYKGHVAENVGDAEVLVVSSAVKSDNPEVLAARGKKIPVIPRAEMLGELMMMKEGIAVAGAHGKTTTSTFIATILSEAGMDPTVVIGGRVKRFGSGGRLGGGRFLVAEADESDGSFLTLSPKIAVVTNIDAEHLDYYGTKENIEAAFFKFCDKVPFFGATVACGDDPVLRSFAPRMNKKYLTYGFSPDCDLVAEDYGIKGLGCVFGVSEGGRRLGNVELRLPGRHNALNACAAIQAAMLLEIDFDTASRALGRFAGIGRRTETKGEKNGVTVIDDYGHHPNEIAATIRGIREGLSGRKIITLFQPHRYTRTRDCLKEFFGAFRDTDVLLLMPIYPAGEKPVEGVSTRLIYDGVVAAGNREVFLMESGDDAEKWITENTRPGDVLLTLGAGDVWRYGEKFLENGKG